MIKILFVCHGRTRADAELIFNICRVLTNMLVVAGECINQVGLYQLRTDEVISEPQNIKELEKYEKSYKNLCQVLHYSKCLAMFQLPESVETLAECALKSKPWNKKLEIFRTANYSRQIVNIVFKMCCPEVHPEIDFTRSIESVMENIMHIQPRAISEIVAHYFDEIERDYNAKKAGGYKQYVGYAYSEILATGVDRFDLKTRIERIQEIDTTVEDNSTVNHIKFVREMSRRGHDALLNAYYSYSKIEEDVHGANDYSALALQFFRVIEIEYCQKILLPLVKSIDICTAENIIKNNEINKRTKDLNSLKKIASGEQQSLEVGVIRTLLYHIKSGNKKSSNAFDEYLLCKLSSLLTDKGKTALQSNEIMDIIDDLTLQRFRVPGAHTGFLPFSVAEESKQYVEEKLPIIESWFIQ